MNHKQANAEAKKLFGVLATVYKRRGWCIVRIPYRSPTGESRVQHLGRGETYQEAIDRARENHPDMIRRVTP